MNLLKLKAKLSKSYSNTGASYNSIYNDLTTQSIRNIKSVENKFFPYLKQVRSTVNDLVDKTFIFDYNEFKEKSLLKPKALKSKLNLFKKNASMNDVNTPINKSNSVCRLLSPNYHSTLNSIFKKKHCKELKKNNLPKLFATSIENTNDNNNTHSNSNTTTYGNNVLLQKNYAIKLLLKKCLEFIEQDNKTLKKLNTSSTSQNKHNNYDDRIYYTKKTQSSPPKINKYNIYNQLNNDTMNLLKDESKWNPLGKKIEAAMDMASKYTINFAVSNSKSLKKKIKEQETSGGYLFVNEDCIHGKNEYAAKHRAMQRKKFKINNRQISLIDFINHSTRKKDLLMKRLESNNIKNNQIKLIEQAREGKYMKIGSYLSGSNHSKKKAINKIKVKFSLNKSL